MNTNVCQNVHKIPTNNKQAAKKLLDPTKPHDKRSRINLAVTFALVA